MWAVAMDSNAGREGFVEGVSGDMAPAIDYIDAQAMLG
jgi:hypothetical protein